MGNGVPIVSDLERAADLLQVDLAELVRAVATAQVPPWGRHASGADVYHWPELVAAVEQTGLPVPDGPAHQWRRYRRKVNAYGTEV